MQATQRQPLQIMPAVYQLLFWRWCKLNEVCDIIPNIAANAGNDFRPSPDELVRLFAAMVRPNRLPKEDVNAPRKKIFRYSRDGQGFGGTEVPINFGFREMATFHLDVERPYPTGLFVPVGWVHDVVNAVALGAMGAIYAIGHVHAYGASGHPVRLVHIEGADGPILVSTPTRTIE